MSTKSAIRQARTNANQVVRPVRNRISKEGYRAARDELLGAAMPLLSAYVDPKEARGIRYPDEFCKQTATFQGIVNVQIPYFPTGSKSVVGEDDGDFLIYFMPSLVDPILAYQRVELPTALHTLGCFCEQQRAHQGVLPLTEDVPTTASTAGGSMVLETGVRYNLVAPWSWNDQSFSFPPFQGISALDGSVFYGVPIRFSATDGMYANFNFASMLNEGATVKIFTVDNSHGEQQFGSTYVVPPGGSYRVTFAQTMGYSDILGRPGIGWRIEVEGNQAYSVLDSFVLSVNTNNTDQARFETINFPDQDQLTEVIDSYRLVSASALATYEGSSLYDGGFISGVLFRGGSPGPQIGLYDYSSVAETPGNYEGPVRDGAYGIWLPNSQLDTLFRPIEDQDRWSHPYIVIAGKMSSSDQLNAMRLQLYANYECVSNSQLFTQSTSSIDPQAVYMTARMLSMFPPFGPNGSHLEKIKDFFKKVAGGVSEVGKWIGENKSWLLPAATSVAALI